MGVFLSLIEILDRISYLVVSNRLYYAVLYFTTYMSLVYVHKTPLWGFLTSGLVSGSPHELSCCVCVMRLAKHVLL